MIGWCSKVRFEARFAGLAVLLPIALAAVSADAGAGGGPHWQQVAQGSTEFDELEALKRLDQGLEGQSLQPAESEVPAAADPAVPEPQPQPEVQSIPSPAKQPDAVEAGDTSQPEPEVQAAPSPAKEPDAGEAGDPAQPVPPIAESIVQPLPDPAKDPVTEPGSPPEAVATEIPAEIERAARPPSTLFEKEIDQLFDPQPLGEVEGVLGDLPVLPPDSPAPQEPESPLADSERAEIIEQLDELNPVMASVGEAPIHWADVTALAARLPDSMQGHLESVFPLLLQRIVDLKLLVMAGRNLRLEQQPELRSQVAAFEEHLIGRTYLDRFLRDRVTPDALRRRYDEVVQERAGSRQIKVRHILLASEDDARAVIADLEQGVDFIALAGERSIGATADRGGSLGRVPVNRMVPAFSAAALALSAGGYTREPVRTQFGWHVILLEEGPDTELPDFAAMEDELRRDVSQREIDRLLQDLRATTAIEIFPGLTGDEASAAAAPQIDPKAESKSE